MAQFLLLIHEPVGQRATRSDAQGRALYDRMLAWGDGLRERGRLHGTQSLSTPTARTAARVAVRGGGTQVLDGPFAEAKEMVGGYFLVECADRGEAIALAATCPAAEWATVEVRSLAPCYE